MLFSMYRSERDKTGWPHFRPTESACSNGRLQGHKRPALALMHRDAVRVRLYKPTRSPEVHVQVPLHARRSDSSSVFTWGGVSRLHARSVGTTEVKATGKQSQGETTSAMHVNKGATMTSALEQTEPPEPEGAAEPEPDQIMEPDALYMCEPDQTMEPDALYVCEPDGIMEPDALYVCEPDGIMEPDALYLCEPDGIMEPDALYVCEPDGIMEPDALYVCEPDGIMEPDALYVCEPDGIMEPDALYVREPDALYVMEPDGVVEPESEDNTEADALCRPESEDNTEADALCRAESEDTTESEADVWMEVESVMDKGGTHLSLRQRRTKHDTSIVPLALSDDRALADEVSLEFDAATTAEVAANNRHMIKNCLDAAIVPHNRRKLGGSRVGYPDDGTPAPAAAAAGVEYQCVYSFNQRNEAKHTQYVLIQ